jgi:Zn-dependent protease/CBS domain-containing protein
MRGRGITLFHLRGIPIRIDASWLIIAALIVWTLSVAYFPRVVPGLDRSLYWLVGSVSALLFFGSVLLHELSHSLVALRAGLPVRSITLFIFGGVSEITEEPRSPRIEFWMAAAGPAASFVIAGITYGLVWLLEQQAPLGDRLNLVQAGLGYLSAINLLLGIFNLVPGFPLDGGRMLRAGLWHWIGDLEKATRWASYGGKIVAGLLMGIGLVALFGGGMITGLWYGFIGLFLWQAADMAYAQMRLQKGLQGHTVSEVMTRPAVAVPGELSLEDFVDQYVFRQRHNAYPVVAAGRPVGLITLQQVRDVPQASWQTTAVADVMTPLAQPLQVTDDLTVAVKRLADSNVAQLPVVSQGQLIGVVSVSDLAMAMERAPLEHRKAA